MTGLVEHLTKSRRDRSYPRRVANLRGRLAQRSPTSPYLLWLFVVLALLGISRFFLTSHTTFN